MRTAGLPAVAIRPLGPDAQVGPHVLNLLSDDLLLGQHAPPALMQRVYELVDADGKEYLDGLSGLWCNSAGNGREELARAAFDQMQTMAYASGYAGSSNP
ncbi:MAG: hypothetical protein ACO3D0_14290, partial [Ilumatobacteraceae bacterium]